MSAADSTLPTPPSQPAPEIELVPLPPPPPAPKPVPKPKPKAGNKGKPAKAAASPPAGPPADDKAARIAKLKDELAKLEGDAPAEPAVLPRFLVKLHDAPSWVVEAPSAGEAFAAYCKATGVISSVNTPEVIPTEAELGRAL